MPRHSRLAYRLQAWGAEIGLGALGLLSLDRASALGGAAGQRLGPSLGITRRARLNIRRALPELGEAEIEWIILGMWDNLGRVVAEYPHLRGIKLFGPKSPVETTGLEHLDAAIADGRRIIFFSGHIGNWEIAALAAGQHGIPVAQIYRAANNPFFDRIVGRLRGDQGELIPKGSVAARQAIAALKRGDHLSMLVDQKMNDGIAVPFFGRPAMTAPALAHLALRYDCAILPVRVERLEGARFRLSVLPPLDAPRSGDHHADVAATMLAVNQTLEGWIRERPDQWFWLHRRWPD